MEKGSKCARLHSLAIEEGGRGGEGRGRSWGGGGGEGGLVDQPCSLCVRYRQSPPQYVLPQPYPTDVPLLRRRQEDEEPVQQVPSAENHSGKSGDLLVDRALPNLRKRARSEDDSGGHEPKGAHHSVLSVSAREHYGRLLGCSAAEPEAFL